MGETERDLLGQFPTAEQALAKVVEAKTKKILAETQGKNKEAAEKKALIERLQKPSGVSDAQALKKATTIIQNAVKNGLTQVQVYRFPSSLCTDRGVAINNQHAGWENTLVGVPKELLEFWRRHLRERGYKLTCEIVDYSGGVLGDVSMTLKWGGQ